MIRRKLTSFPTLEELLDNQRHQIHNRIAVNIMHQNNGTSIPQPGREQSQRLSHRVRRIVLPVKSIYIGINDVVPKFAQDLQGLAVVAQERRTHVDGKFAEDFDEFVLQLGHF